jgi:hypothetical protein
MMQGGLWEDSVNGELMNIPSSLLITLQQDAGIAMKDLRLVNIADKASKGKDQLDA